MNRSAFTHYQARTRHGRWMGEQYTPSLVSVIIPSYNRENLIGQTLDSVVAQSYRPIEVLVVDDGSTDSTLEIVRGYQERFSADPSFHVRMFLPGHGGGCSARNFGCIESRGEFIQFLDSDDLIDPRKLQVQIDLLHSNPKCGIAFGDKVVFIDEPPTPAPMGDAAVAINPDELLATQRLLTTEGIYRREVVRTAGAWPEDLFVGDDMTFNFRALLACDEVLYRSGGMWWYRQHPGQRNTDGMNTARGQLELQICDRVAELAKEFEVLSRPALIETLSVSYTTGILSALNDGDGALARRGIAACWRLPVTVARRARLALLWQMSYLPRWPYLRLRDAMLGISRSLRRSAGPA